MVVGSDRTTSSAWVGPDRAETAAQGISCRMISTWVAYVPSSTPLVTAVMRWPSRIYGAIRFAVLLVKGEATAKIRRS